MSNQSEIAQQYHDNGIYVVFLLRGALPHFHWAIFVAKASPIGCKWHATNRSGGWELEVQDLNETPFDISLCLAFKVGAATNWNTLRQLLSTIPANGDPSGFTGLPFKCVTWAQDALQVLHNAGVITLGHAITDIEDWAESVAESHREEVESGRGTAKVINDPDYNVI